MSRIDYWLTPCNLHKEDISVNILPTPLTDHKAVSINISLLSSPSSNYHNSYWKLNKSLLEHEFVKMTIRSLIAQYCNIAQISNNYYTNWELFKFEACKFLRKFGSLLSKARKFEEEMIISKITSFTHKSPNLSDNEYLELFTLQSQLDDIYKRRAEGAFIRFRHSWLEKGEQNSAFFFQLEKKHAKANTIVHLNINGTITSDSKDIADYCSTFFSTLYNSGFNEDNSSVFIDSLTNSKTINEDQKEHCDSSICIKEVLQAITELKLNKSPGIDGLNSEFYKTFSEELAPFLLKLFLQSIEYGKLPPTLTQGLIILIPKPKKDTLILDNWRPISLLNNDYKILASILASRIKTTLDSIIDDTQSGFMRNRHISNNICLVLDLVDYPHLYPDESFILFLDFHKAFDTIEHHFIYSALNKFGFGDFFINSIKTLYYDANCSIKLLAPHPDLISVVVSDRDALSLHMYFYFVHNFLQTMLNRAL